MVTIKKIEIKGFFGKGDLEWNLNPDLCMHIDWKEELITRLHKINPNMQIILSTHSPIVITGWMDCVNEVSQLINK